MNTKAGRLIVLFFLIGVALLSACASSPAAEATPVNQAAATLSATGTSEPTAAPTATDVSEIEPGLRRLTNLDEFQQQFNSDQGKQRVILLLSTGCPSCVVGAEWLSENVLGEGTESETQVYAVWFPTVASDQMPSDSNPLWSPDAIEGPNVISYWDSQGIVSTFFAQNVELEGIERSTVPQTFGGLQWGSSVWDVVYLFSPEAQWEGGLPEP
ncbi:MAG: hypothetical protein ACLFWD_10385, partial [Anaerolineales bacterium]